MSNPSDQGLLSEHVRNDAPAADGPDEQNADATEPSSPPDDPAEHIDPDIDPHSTPPYKG